MFDALANLSSSIPDAYRQAFECGDLNMGDLHLIQLTSYLSISVLLSFLLLLFILLCYHFSELTKMQWSSNLEFP